MLNWLYAGGVLHDGTTARCRSLHSLSHDMHYGSDGGSEHWPSHWSVHEHSGNAYFFKILS